VDDLQFDRVESAAPPLPGTGEAVTPTPGASPMGTAPGVTVCGACGEPIADAYYEANGKIVCPRCREAVLASQAGGSGIARFFKATMFGVLAGIVGAAIWWAVRAGTGYEVGLIAIVVGIIVGGAIKAGSQGRGGVGYQLLAVVLTYLSIAANYVPDIVRALKAETDVGDNLPALVIISAVTAVAAPFFGGLKNIIGLLIIGFALYQAWIINRPNRISFNGPYRLAPGGAAPAGMPYGVPPVPPPAGRA
jgi:hypothetical protein